jgi:hypothetical protein
MYEPDHIPITSGPFWATLAVRYLTNMSLLSGTASISTVMPGLAASKRAIALEI